MPRYIFMGEYNDIHYYKSEGKIYYFKRPYLSLHLFEGYFFGKEYTAKHEKRDFTPCIYCHRYDEHVKDLDENGLKGRYHDRCASRVLHDTMKELFVRMS